MVLVAAAVIQKLLLVSGVWVAKMTCNIGMPRGNLVRSNRFLGWCPVGTIHTVNGMHATSGHA